MNNKGQASLEYLTTYGWAFILIIVMIGAITYFGILNPKKLLPERCNFSSEIECKDYKISAGGLLRLKLKNNAGQPIKIQGISLSSESVPVLCGGVFFGDTENTALGVTWGQGEVIDLRITGCDYDAVGITIGSKEKLSVTINYYNAKSTDTYLHTVDGEVFSTVQ